MLPIAERHHDYAAKVFVELKNAGIRVENDQRREKIGYKIREAHVQKIPYMLVLGDKEAETGEIAVRHRSAGDLGSFSIGAFIARIREEIDGKLR